MRCTWGLYFAIAALAACGPDAGLDGLADAGTVRTGAALTGDTLEASGRAPLHLAGVVAPRPGEPYATEAKATLEGLAGHRDVRMLSGGDAEGVHLRDPRTRRWIERELLLAGAVRVRSSADDRAMVREMLQAEARARAAGRGLWSLPAYEVRLPQEVISRELDGFQVVEGRVAHATEAAGRLYLEFGREWRGGFSTETPLASLAAFEAAGLDLQGLTGRLVRVRGDVRPTRFGPRLRLDHPEQVERLADPVKR